MSTALNKAALISAPNDLDDSANEFGVKKFTATTTHAADAVPDGWKGRWVVITSVGGNLHYAFSKLSTAEVDRSVSATAAGASEKVGGYIPNGGERHRVLPLCSGTLYFVREADAAADVYVELSDRQTSHD